MKELEFHFFTSVRFHYEISNAVGNVLDLLFSIYPSFVTSGDFYEIALFQLTKNQGSTPV